MISKAMTIAGSDSGGGAGIQADLKTFTVLGVHGASVVTALTAQNTRGVMAVSTPEPEFVEQQIEAVMSDIGAGAAKTGMLASGPIIEAVARGLGRWPIDNLVVDPVMVATSGDRLLEAEAIGLLRESIAPLALLITPNLPEAEALTEIPVDTENGMKAAAEKLIGLGARTVLIKGGHAGEADSSNDLFFDGREFRLFRARRIATGPMHGSGCTLSAAIAAYLARGNELTEAIGRAKLYVTRAIERAQPIGGGSIPLFHGYDAAEPPNEDK